MAHTFETTPMGYVKAKERGWLEPARTPHKAKLDKLSQENTDLKARLDALEAAMLKEKE